MRLSESRDDAEDLVQDTLAGLLRTAPRISHEAEFSYVYRSLRNAWVSSRRRHRATLLLRGKAQVCADRDTVVSEPGEELLAVLAVEEAIVALSPVLSKTLIAVDVIGLSYLQAAEALAAPPGTIMSRLHRARSAVRAQIASTEAHQTSARGPAFDSDTARLLAGRLEAFAPAVARARPARFRQTSGTTGRRVDAA
jgi:RNA polymerase sigma-70 factor (ECF subfamily)